MAACEVGTDPGDLRYPHPSLWSFMDRIQRNIQKQKDLFLQWVTGIEHLRN